MDQHKELLKSILVSSLLTNVIVLAMMGLSLATVLKVKEQVDDIHERLETVHAVVDEIKEVRGNVKERMRERRQGDADGEGSAVGPAPSRPRPLQRLRNR